MTRLPTSPSPKRLGLVIDLDTCVGCHACATNCKEWNSGAISGPLTRTVNALSRRAARRLVQPGFLLRGERRELRVANRAFPQELPALREAGLRYRLPDRRQLQARRRWHRADRSRQMHRLRAVFVVGVPVHGARRLDEDQGVMKKCTLCVDKIYNTNLPEADRVPACVSTCPASARHFGDFNDP